MPIFSTSLLFTAFTALVFDVGYRLTTVNSREIYSHKFEYIY